MANYEDGYDAKYGYNRNAFTHRPPQVQIVGSLVQSIAAPIALVKEVVASRKGKEDTAVTAAAGSEQIIPPDRDANEPGNREHPQGESSSEDEAEWALDEVNDRYAPPDEDVIAPADLQSRDASVQALVSSIRNDAPPLQTPPKPLPFPVVLPQRRPGTKARGFVRAYAPALEDAGISQNTFMNFLKNFHTASQASPTFNVIMIGAGIASCYPSGIAQAVAIAVQAAASVGREMQERWRMNKFLDQANRDVFMPCGLYAVVVCYKPTVNDGDVPVTKAVDVGAMAMAKYGGSLNVSEGRDGEQTKEEQSMTEEMKQKMQRLRVASAKTHGQREMPVDCAPLVFPALESATEQGADAKKVQSLVAGTKGASKFVQQYFDKRAQAVFNAANKDSTLAGMQPIPTFASDMSDPLDARNMHFFSLITGGKIKAEPLGAQRRWEKAQKKAAEKRAKGLKEQSVKRGLKEDVLYLMVVNLPTEAELEVARKEIKEAKEKQGPRT